MATLTDDNPIVVMEEQFDTPLPCAHTNSVPPCSTVEVHDATWCILWSCGCSYNYCDGAHRLWMSGHLGSCYSCGAPLVHAVMDAPL